MARRKASRRFRGDWSVDFAVPRTRWSDMTAEEGERQRASRRAYLRRTLAPAVYARAIDADTIWRVERFVLLVGVSYPTDAPYVPAYATEVVKPLVDAGTDAGLWVDDDSNHRVNTVFCPMDDRWHDGQYHLKFIVLNVPPRFRLEDRFRSWFAQHGQAPQKFCLNIPHKLWITSNFNDSDLVARQAGNGVYGSTARFAGAAQQNRRNLRANLMAFALKGWTDYRNVRMDGGYLALVGVAYPSGNDADPDNATESVLAALAAGAVGSNPHVGGITTEHCGGIALYRLPTPALPSYHRLEISLYPRPMNIGSLISGELVGPAPTRGPSPRA